MGLKLVLKANLEGLTDLRPIDTAESPFEYTFEIACISCRETHDKNITINRFEQHEMARSKGEANFVFKCKNCKREHSASIERTTNNYTVEDNGKEVAILNIDARGLDVLRFIPEGIFEAKGAETTTKFSEIEIDESEYYDYDDNAGAEVSITDATWEIVRS